MTVGVDVGGTKIRAVVWNGRKVIRSAETKTPNHQEKFGEAVQSFKKNAAALGVSIGELLK